MASPERITLLLRHLVIVLHFIYHDGHEAIFTDINGEAF